MFSREELYELVWSVPMTRVGEKFKLPGSYMARVARPYMSRVRSEVTGLSSRSEKPLRSLHCQMRNQVTNSAGPRVKYYERPLDPDV
jgi:hypothetical protein